MPVPRPLDDLRGPFSRSVRALSVLGLLVLAIPLAAAGAAVPSTHQGGSAVLAQPNLAALATTLKCKDCWAGYGVVNSSGHVSAVSATVTVPKVTCKSSPDTLAYYEVGLDGLSSTKDTAIAFVYSFCASGILYQDAGYYATSLGSTIRGFFAVSAGTKVTLSVAYHAGNFTFIAATSTINRTATASAAGAALVSAECVTNMGGTYGLAHFGPVHFGDCSARINHVWADIGKFGTAATLTKYVCYNSTGTSVLARTGMLVHHTDFTVKFVKSGP
ncbi:MAG: G1 family endopeptidase [Thermoplasmata archaeon]|nr:G1 family endopeptidase [Thermoplasmata archaeon]